MNGLLLFVSVLGVGLCVVLAGVWWLYAASEGVYLGQRTVTRLYDQVAPRYDAIKQYDAEWEHETLAEPLLATIAPIATPHLLDVGTGTGRLPAVLWRAGWSGSLLGLDASLPMLRFAAAKYAHAREQRPVPLFIQQPAEALPFDDAAFDAVVSLEALEFFADEQRVLAEMVRVLKPGGVLLITNRKGWQRWLMLGHTQTSQRAARRLRDRYGLEDISISIWQLDYDLIWAYKRGLLEPTVMLNSANSAEFVRCPNLHAGVHRGLCAAAEGWSCQTCGAVIPHDDIADVMPYGAAAST